MTPEEAVSAALCPVLVGCMYVDGCKKCVCADHQLEEAKYFITALSAAGYVIVPRDGNDKIWGAIYEAETMRCTSPEVWQAAISAALNEG